MSIVLADQQTETVRPSRQREPKAGTPSPVRLSLRAKGIIALAALALYMIAVGVVIMLEREKMPRLVSELHRVHQQGEQLIQLNMSVAHAILGVNENYHAADLNLARQMIALDVEAVQSGLQGLAESFPNLRDNDRNFERLMAELNSNPRRATLAELRGAFHNLVVDLDIITARSQERREKLLAEYRASYDTVTIQYLMTGLVGIVITGGAMTIFFTRLAWDIRKVRARAIEVVNGYRGPPMAVTRSDELGALIEAVNDMQHQLRQREAQIDLARQQAFHQEKMAAVGSLAAAVGHELNNPLSAIMGLVQAMKDERDARGGPPNCPCEPDLLWEQVRRVAQITRQLSEFSGNRNQERQLVDLNGLVRGTCTFVTYDRRFRAIELKTDLDDQVPAVMGVADHLTQVLMNLLFNSADACEGVEGRKPVIKVTTRRTAAGGVTLAVTDNGCGMDEATRKRVFEEYFTTKPAGKGTGLGMAICKSLVDAHGGTIDIQSEPGTGSTITVTLPTGGE
jgi:signal transduction histidine kinase